LHCALNQTYRDIEILVVDDCSSDETSDVASSFAPRVIAYENEIHRGIGGNWNRCVELSKGAAYLLIAHQDDLMSATLVERAVELLEREPAAGFAMAPVEQIDEKGRVIEARESAEGDFVRPGAEYFERLMEGSMPMWGPVAGVVRRALYDQAGVFDETYSYAVDLQMHFRMLLQADAGFLAEPRYQWRRHENQATSRHNKGQRYEEVIRAKLEGVKLAERSGGFDPPALARLRRAAARDCCKAARRYALADAGYARRHLRHAWSLCHGSLLKNDFLAGSLRMIWTGLFGPTAAGRARFERTGI
jgi:glycosyltransferase involved in cell wall biosynthesis